MRGGHEEAGEKKQEEEEVEEQEVAGNGMARRPLNLCTTAIYSSHDATLTSADLGDQRTKL